MVLPPSARGTEWSWPNSVGHARFGERSARSGSDPRGPPARGAPLAHRLDHVDKVLDVEVVAGAGADAARRAISAPVRRTVRNRRWKTSPSSSRPGGARVHRPAHVCRRRPTLPSRRAVRRGQPTRRVTRESVARCGRRRRTFKECDFGLCCRVAGVAHDDTVEKGGCHGSLPRHDSDVRRCGSPNLPAVRGRAACPGRRL